MLASYFVVLAIAFLCKGAEEMPNLDHEKKATETPNNDCPVPLEGNPDFLHDINCGERGAPVYLCDYYGRPCERFICRCTEAKNSNSTGWYRYGGKYPLKTSKSPDRKLWS